MSKPKIAVRDKVIVNETSAEMDFYPAYLWGRVHNAIGWLGDRYVCAKPAKRFNNTVRQTSLTQGS